MGLAVVVLRIISSQSRLTHHQVGRIQALYAGKAGVVFAVDMLRKGTWTASGTYSITDANLLAPNTAVTGVSVVIGDAGVGPVGTRRISATASYTYTP